MLEKVNTVLNITTAFKIIGLLQKRKFRGKGILYVNDPFLSHKRLHINTHGLMEPNLVGFGTGTWLDFVVYTKQVSYRNALKETLSALNKEDVLPEEDVFDVAAVLMANKSVLDVLAKHRHTYMLDGSATAVKNYVKMHTVQPEFCKNAIMAIPGGVLNHFSDLSAQFFRPTKACGKFFKEDHVYACVPYFINHHMIDHIDVYQVGKKLKKYATIPFFESKFSFTNIWSAPLNTINLNLFVNTETVLAVAEKHINFGPNIGFSNVSVNEKGCWHELYYKYNACYFPAEEEDIADILQYSDAFSRFNISKDFNFLRKKTEDLHDVLGYLKTTLKNFYLEDKSYSPRIAELVTSVKDKELYISEFLAMAEAHNWEMLVDMLQSIQNNNTLFEAKTYTLFRTGDSYVVRYNSNAVRAKVTNFLINVKQKIIFRNDPDHYYDVEVSFEQNIYQMFVSHKQINSDDKLKNLIHRAFVSNIPLNSTQIDINVPTVYGVSVTRVLTHIFAQEAKKAKTVLGTNNLGFNDDKSVWMLYDGVVTNDGYSRQKNYIKPTSIVLNKYFQRPAKVRMQTEVDSRVGRLLIAAFVCNAVRSYYQGVFVPICIDKTAWRPMMALLSEFGQSELIKLQRNFTTADLSEINGLPFLVSNTEEVSSPCFMLNGNKNDAPVWLMPNAEFTEQNMLALAPTFRAVMIRCMQSLIDGVQSDYLYKMFDNKSIENMTYMDMAQEGAYILELLEVTKKWEIDPVSASFKEFVSSLPKSSTFYVNAGEKQIGYNLKLFENELAQNKIDYSVKDNNVFHLKKKQLTSLVNN